MKKAYTLSQIDNAVRFDIPVDPNHPFYVDFSDVRGDFEERVVYKALNVNPSDYKYNTEVNRLNKTLLFFGGMRGSGKTSEINKYVSKLENPDCFFCVVCNIDMELDLNDVEYMDILIFQLEKLVEKAKDKNLILDIGVIKSMQDWFSERVNEINSSIKREGGSEIEISAETPSFFSIFKIAAKLKASISGSKENALKIRNTFKNRFSDFALKFNEFVEYVNLELRKRGIAKEILFAIDGLEKTMSVEVRRKIIMEESNRLRQIRANTIFTLPIELMKERQKLNMFSTVISFPFVKLIEKDGTIFESAIKKFFEFVYKRIDEKLFDSAETVRKAILYCGGSPRELLRILEYANLYTDESKGRIDSQSVDKALTRLAAEYSTYITSKDLERLKILKDNNAKNIQTPFDEGWQELLEYLIIFEYNDGTYKRVNPIVELSNLYKQHVS